MRQGNALPDRGHVRVGDPPSGRRGNGRRGNWGRMDEVLDCGVGAGVDESNVTVIRPPHQIRRSTVRSVYFHDLSVAIGLAHMVPLHDQAVSDICLHRAASSMKLLCLYEMLCVHHVTRTPGHPGSNVTSSPPAARLWAVDSRLGVRVDPGAPWCIGDRRMPNRQRGWEGAPSVAAPSSVPGGRPPEGHHGADRRSSGCAETRVLVGPSRSPSTGRWSGVCRSLRRTRLWSSCQRGLEEDRVLTRPSATTIMVMAVEVW